MSDSMHDDIITMSDSILQILDEFISTFEQCYSEGPGEQPGMTTLNGITCAGVVSLSRTRFAFTFERTIVSAARKS